MECAFDSTGVLSDRLSRADYWGFPILTRLSRLTEDEIKSLEEIFDLDEESRAILRSRSSSEADLQAEADAMRDMIAKAQKKMRDNLKD